MWNFSERMIFWIYYTTEEKYDHIQLFIHNYAYFKTPKFRNWNICFIVFHSTWQHLNDAAFKLVVNISCEPCEVTCFKELSNTLGWIYFKGIGVPERHSSSNAKHRLWKFSWKDRPYYRIFSNLTVFSILLLKQIKSISKTLEISHWTAS